MSPSYAVVELGLKAKAPFMPTSMEMIFAVTTTVSAKTEMIVENIAIGLFIVDLFCVC
jgi:hypothetical protein